MDSKVMILGQIDNKKFNVGQKDHREFNLGETRAIGFITPTTEELNVVPSEEVQEFVPTPNTYYDKVVVGAIPSDTYINITKPENVYAGQVEVENND